MPSAQQTLVHKLQGLRQPALLHADAGQMVEGSPCGFSAPSGLEKRVVGVRQPVQQLLRQAQVEIRFSGVGIGVPPGLLADGGLEERHALLNLPVAQQIQAVGVVEPNIGGIAAQPLQVIVGGQERGVAVLLQVLPGQV